MKIGIVGSGNMGRTLGMLWADQGHEVFFGARREDSLEYIRSLTSQPVLSGSLEDAVTFGDVLLYSLRETMPSSVAARQKYKDKVLIDPNNGEIPVDFHYPPVTQSYTEAYQADVPKAQIVKAFNTMAQELYYHPADMIRQHRLAGPFCADTERSRRIVRQLIEDTGLMPLDCGTVRQGSRLLESLADLTRLLMIRQQRGPYLAFSAVTLPEATAAHYGTRQPTRYQ